MWPWRKKVLLVSELGIHPGGVLLAEGDTHTCTSSPSFALGPIKRKVVCSNYMQVHIQMCLQIPVQMTSESRSGACSRAFQQLKFVDLKVGRLFWKMAGLNVTITGCPDLSKPTEEFLLSMSMQAWTPLADIMPGFNESIIWSIVY